MDITTLRGSPATILGLAGQESTEPGCVNLAWRAGINYFFSYTMGDGPFFKELRQLLQAHRESVIVATDSEPLGNPQPMPADGEMDL
jgi:hypothetical protein